MIRPGELKKDFYKPKEVGDMIGKGPRVVSDMVRHGKLEAMRSDTNRILIPKDTVMQLLDRFGLLLEDEEKRRDVSLLP